MRATSHSFVIGAALLGLTACSAEIEEPPEVVQEIPQEVSAAAVWTAATTAVDVIKNLYTGINWFNCNVAGTCPVSEAERQATRVIGEIENTIARQFTIEKISEVNVLLERAARDYAHPELVSTFEEQDLVNDAIALHIHFRDKLNFTNPANVGEVEIAYALAPFFNVLAALVDNISQIALRNGRISIDWASINARRADTLATNYALVGAQSLWYQCPGSTAPTLVNTVQSSTNAFPTKKLWAKFANYDFNKTICEDTYTCNVFNRANPATNRAICRRSKCSLGGLFCHACGVGQADWVYDEELPKILAKMDRDQNVIVVRTGMETLVALAAEHASGIVMSTSIGQHELWNLWSRTSYKLTPLVAPGTGWTVAATGDFNADNIGDVLWTNPSKDSFRLSLLDEYGVASTTPPTQNALGEAGLKAFTGDLDGDRVSDIVFSGVGFVSYVGHIWMMNRGSTTPRSISNVSSPSEIVEGVGNFDGDAQGRADILFRTPSTGLVSIQISGGARIDVARPPAEWVIKGVADFNRDRNADILWYNPVTAELSIWAMAGGAIAAFSPVVARGFSAEGVGDLDHDGVPDIITRGTDGSIRVLYMNTNFVVRDASSVYASSVANKFAGVVDLGPAVPANIAALPISEPFCGASTAQLKNPGFTPPTTLFGSLFDGGKGTFVGDVTGDRRADLVGLGVGFVGVVRANGGVGTFETWRTDSAWRGADGSTLLNQLADVTGDGLADLVGLGAGRAAVMRSDGNKFGNYQNWYNGWIKEARGNLIGDVDGDRRADLIGLGNTYVAVQRSNGGSFGHPVVWLNQAFTGAPNLTLVGDVTGDGRDDVVGVVLGNTRVIRSNGTFFGLPEKWSSASFVGAKVTLLADVTGDKRADLIAVNNDGIRIMRSRGNDFGPPEVWYSMQAFGTRGTFVGDVDANQKGDIVAAGDFNVNLFRSQ